MADDQIHNGLDDIADEDLAMLLEFVESAGSVEEAREAIDALSQLREAA
jgi:hypothetical protein